MSKNLNLSEELKYIRLVSDIKKIYETFGEEKVLEYINQLSEKQVYILERKSLKGDNFFDYIRGFIGMKPSKAEADATKPLEGEILSSPKPGETSTQMKDVTPPKTGALTAVDQVSDVPSFAKKNNLASKVAPIVGIGAGAAGVYGVNKLVGSGGTTDTADAGVPPQDMLGGSSPGTTADVSGTEFKPEPKEEPKDYPTSRITDPVPTSKLKIKSGETLSQLAQKNKVSVNDIMLANPELKDPHKIMAGAEINMPSQTGNKIYQYGVGTKSGPAKVDPIKKVNESLLDAFNKVVNSKHPNLFQEAAKGSEPKNEKEKKLAALAEPKDKITHKDVLVGRGVVKEDEQLEEGKKKYSDAKPKMYSDTMKAATKFKDSDVSRMIRDEKARKASMKEDANLFSAEELAFFEAIAPTPEDHAPQGGIKKKTDGSKSGTLSDEYIMDKSVVGKGTITTTDPKTGKKMDYISPVTLNNPHMQASQDEFKVPNPIPVPKPRPKNLGEAKNSEENEPVATGANKLHMNVKKAADYNTPNVKHTFENGEQVTLTRGMAGDFLARHSSAKTADDKDAILKHANKSLEAFKAVARGAKVPSAKETLAKPKVSLGSMKGK